MTWPGCGPRAVPPMLRRCCLPPMETPVNQDLDSQALAYHRYPKPGKLEIKATKPLANQQDLALAYSPGVAAACREIVRDPLTAADYTARGNLVAVISNGTAVLGLGAIGALASKPVMEGKAVLFKEFADIDVFDIEVDERDPQAFINTVARLEPSFGGINLEDIKAPECFIIEEALKERMGIPVFHDDQHGTAIVVSAAIFNGLRVVGKDIAEVRLVTAGAGAAALACLGLLVDLGLRQENIIVTDIAGVVYTGRVEEMDPYKCRFAVDTPLRTLEQALEGADIFLGLSAAGVLKAEWLPKMAQRPIIMALANPTPEILPALARAARPDAIIATGRSDFPNQVNNVLCFPFLFRGALDCGAREINAAMKTAAVRAIADLAMQEPSDIVRSAYGGQNLKFGPEYLIPRPFDPRLMEQVAPAVAEAAAESGVARRPIADLAAYAESLHHRVFRTGMTMKAVFDQARESPKRVVYAEGEDERVLQAAQQAIGLGIARPILIGNRVRVEAKLAELGLGMRLDEDCDLIDPQDNPRFEIHLNAFYPGVKRHGYSPRGGRRGPVRQPHGPGLCRVALRRRRCPDLRGHRALRASPATGRAGHRPSLRGRAPDLHERCRPALRHHLHRRYLCATRPQRRGIGRDHPAVRRRVRRDRQDSEREIAPLRPSDDGVLVDSTGKTIGEVVEEMLGVVRRISSKTL